jgi:4-hydroxybenzoate polyprenyltransferase
MSVAGRSIRRAWWIPFLIGRPDAWGPATVSAAFALILHDAVTPKTALLVFAIAALYWLGYVINDYFDASIDAQDEHKMDGNVFVRCPQPQWCLGVATVVVLSAVLPIFGWFGLRGLVVFAVANLAMWAYSGRPLRLKTKPGLDLLTHGLFVLTFPYSASLELIDADWSKSDWIVVGFAFCTSLAGQLRQQVRDFELDSRNGRNFTTTVGLGTSLLLVKTVTFVSFFAFVVSTLMGLVPHAAVPIGILSLPAVLDRLTAARATQPPKRLYNLLSLAAAGYCVLLFWASLFWDADPVR